MKTYKEFTQQIDEKVWDADGRNTTELKKQVRGLDDEHLKDWSKNKKSIFDTKTKKVQDRIISHEIKKRGLNKEEVELDETLSPDQGAGEYIKDFKKSDAPQFKGKSPEKRRQMGIAAYINAKRNK